MAPGGRRCGRATAECGGGTPSPVPPTCEEQLGRLVQNARDPALGGTAWSGRGCEWRTGGQVQPEPEDPERERKSRRMKKVAEFSVFQGGSPSTRRTPSAREKLYKPKSLTNLTLLSEARPRGHALELEAWKRGVDHTPGDPQQRARTRSLSLSLSNVFFRSQSPLARAARPPDVRAASAHPPLGGRRRGGVGEGTDEEGSSSRSGDEAGAHAPGLDTTGGLWGEEEHGCAREGTAHLDQEVILTMLGDLEQALHSHSLRKCHLSPKSTASPSTPDSMLLIGHRYFCYGGFRLVVFSWGI